MLSEYADIIEAMTALMRVSHAETKLHGDGPSPRCSDKIDPVTEMCRCEAQPLWWDEHGTPRFRAHHPDLCPDIYVDEVALLKIACQACGREFLVQMSSGPYATAREMAMAGTHGAVPRLLEEALAMLNVALGTDPAPMLDRTTAIATELTELRKRRPQTLADQVTAGVIHFGDPPNVGCCCAGPTMNCDDLAVVEFWRRGHAPWKAWERVAELEIQLPDGREAP